MGYDIASSATCGTPGLLGPSLTEICKSPKFIVFMTILNEFVYNNERLSGICDRVKQTVKPDAEYDFVIVGGGAAGSAIAGRLSENPDWKIMLIEAGPEPSLGTEVPAFSSYLLGSPLDWNYRTMNEKYACRSHNGSCKVHAGKVLGGGTAINGMVYLRGVPKDYDNWAAQGNKGWAWDDVLPYFKKAENNGDIDKVGRHYHGTGGPLSVETCKSLPDFAHSVLKASDERGYGFSEDLNGERFTGFAIVQGTYEKGVRRSSAAAYLRPARNRSNLHVSVNSFVTKVIMKKDKAVGVEYIQNGELRTVRASREVIISAGTIRSPQILLLSGIGPKKHLKSVDVKVVKDLPGVGENLHDHIVLVLPYTINESDKFSHDYRTATEYFVNQTGPLSCGGLNVIRARLTSKTANPDYPDIQLAFNGYPANCEPDEDGTPYNRDKRTVYMRNIYLHPKSRGRISLASNDPLEDPNIRFNFLSNRKDVDGLIEAIKLGLAMANTEAMKAHNFTLAVQPIEACSDYEFLSTEYWDCAIHQNHGISDLHPAGSCKMGPISDPMAVVDHRLRVYKVKGLRVADASIMPTVTSGNTAAPSIMIGERAADFIKGDWLPNYKEENAPRCDLEETENIPLKTFI